MKFYTVKKTGTKGQNLSVVDDQAERLYLYVPNFKTFHHDQQLEDEFYFPDPVDGSELEFQEISAVRAAELIRELKSFDARYDVQRRLLEEYRAQLNSPNEVLTIAEAGVVNTPELPRPTRSQGLPELLLARAKRRQWTTMFLYDQQNASSAPREAARLMRNNNALLKIATSNNRTVHVETVKLGRAVTEVRVRLEKNIASTQSARGRRLSAAV